MTSAAVLAIGSELTRGELLDTNSHWLAERLASAGLEVAELVSVADDRARIAETLRRLGGLVQLVVVTGGLGPTSDDMTAEAVAAARGEGLRRDEAALEAIRQRYRERGRSMPESNVKQAEVPEGAEVLPNAVGTAPGFAARVGGAEVVCLPGVPREMRHLFAQYLAPRLEGLAPGRTHQIRLRTFGLPESQIADQLAGLEAGLPAGVKVGYRAHFPEIEVKILARAADAQAARATARAVADEARAELGEAVFGEGGTPFAEHVGRALREAGVGLALAESCTGGLVAKMLSDVPGSSEYLMFGVVSYSNPAKRDLLGVSDELLAAHGAVSAQVAAAMAEGALRRGEADLAVSVTGIAGPGGGSEDKPVGTVWFGLASRGATTTTRHRRLFGDRERIRVLSAYIALDMAAKHVRSRLDEASRSSSGVLTEPSPVEQQPVGREKKR